MNSDSPDDALGAPFAPQTLAESVNARERSTSARQAALLAADRCAILLRRSIIRYHESERILDESERVVQQLRAAVEFYARTLRAESFPPETTITLVRGVVDNLNAAVDEKDVLGSAAVRWAIEAYYSAA